MLNVPRDAPEEELRRAYQRLAREHHPDRTGSDDDSTFLLVQEAWERLRDPQACARASQITRAPRLLVMLLTGGCSQARRRYDAELRMVEMEQAHSCALMSDVELDEMDHSEDEQGSRQWSYPCRCGDVFVLTAAMLEDGHDSIECQSCSLSIRVSVPAEAAQLQAG